MPEYLRILEVLINLDISTTCSHTVKMNKYYILIVKKEKRIIWERIISGRDSLL